MNEAREKIFQILEKEIPPSVLESVKPIIDVLFTCMKKEMIDEYIRPIMELHEGQNKLNQSDKVLQTQVVQEIQGLKERISFLEERFAHISNDVH